MAQRILNFADGFESSSSPSSSGSTGGGGEVDNLGVTLAAGVFSITAADGTALSSSNLATIKMPSTTDGMVKTLSVDANVSFQDDNGTSDIIGEEFGTTAGIAWSEDRPFYLYAVNTDDTNSGIYFAISPNPSASQTPNTTGEIAYKGNPGSSPTDRNFFFLTSTNVTAEVDKPCKLIGGIRMQKSASDDWTVQSVSGANGDGISTHPYVSKLFTFPQGQMGAVSGSYLSAGASTIPTWATPANFMFKYKLRLTGDIDCSYSTISAGNCTNGVGVDSLLLHLPYKAALSTGLFYPVGNYDVTLAQDGFGTSIGQFVNDNSFTPLFDSDRTFLFPQNFTNANDDISGFFTYQAFFE